MSLDSSISGCRLVQTGGEASVYRAFRGSGGHVVALKVYKAHRAFNESLIQFLKSGKHPNVASLYATGAADGYTFTVSEYIRGVTSSALVPMPPSVAVHLLRGVSAGLSALARAGLSHGDLNPENVLVRSDASPVLIDCGIEGLGAPRFAAPERFAGKAPSVKSDLFSAGLLLYFWIAGEPLFAGEKFESVASQISDVDQCDVSLLLHGKGRLSPAALGILDPLWKGLLRRDPDARFEDFDELSEVLEIAEAHFFPRPGSFEKKEADLWLSALRARVAERETAVDKRTVTEPLAVQKKSRKKFMCILAASLFVVLAAAGLCLYLFPWGNVPVDQVGAKMLETSRRIPTEDSSARNDVEQKGTWRGVLLGAPTPVQEEKEESK
jgi:serine/threonine protein kinase